MSVQAMAWVLDHSPAKGTDRLVLLSIANHADKSPSDGAWEAWPGIATIQREAALDRTRTVNDALSRLIEAGHLERIINGAPDQRIRADHRPNLYRVLLSNGVPCGDTRCGCHGVTPDDERDDVPRPDGVTPDDITGCRETSSEPSLNRKDEPSSTKGKRSSFPDAFRLTPEMRAWAAKEVPGVDLSFQTRQFADHWRGKGEKRADWVATWRTWMRNAKQWNRGSSAPAPPPDPLPITGPVTIDPDPDYDYEAWMDEHDPKWREREARGVRS